MVQDFCGLQGDERWCGGVGGGFGWSTVVWREVKGQ